MKPKNTGYEKDDMLDSSVYGKYLIIGTRHIIQNGKHETVLEVARESTQDVLNENNINLKDIIGYGE
jgi:hypothetical protein